MVSEILHFSPLEKNVLSTMRRKFFDWNDVIATSKIFNNETTERDVFSIEVLAEKLSD